MLTPESTPPAPAAVEPTTPAIAVDGDGLSAVAASNADRLNPFQQLNMFAQLQPDQVAGASFADLRAVVDPLLKLPPERLKVHSVSMPPESDRGSDLPVKTKQELSGQAAQGLALLDEPKEADKPQGLKRMQDENERAMIGVEIETIVVEAEGVEPASTGSRIASAIEKSTDVHERLAKLVKPELHRSDVEFNLRPVLATSKFPGGELCAEALNLDELVTRFAGDRGARVGCTAVSSLMGVDTFDYEHVADNPRYDALLRGMRNLHEKFAAGGDFTTTVGEGDDQTTFACFTIGERLEDGETLENGSTFRKKERVGLLSYPDPINPDIKRVFIIRDVRPFLEGLMTSVQIHITVEDQSHYKEFHRTLDVMAPLIYAYSAGANLWEETLLPADIRNWLWSTSLHKQRCETDRHLDDVLDQHRQVALAEVGTDSEIHCTIMAPGEANKQTLVVFDDADKNRAVQIVDEQQKGEWPRTRVVLYVNPGEFSSGKFLARSEVRIPSSGMTYSHVSAFAVGLSAAARGRYKAWMDTGSEVDLSCSSDEFERYFKMDTVNRDVYLAGAKALDAEVSWVKGRRDDGQTARTLWIESLLPVMNQQLHDDGLTQEEREKVVTMVASPLFFDWRENMPTYNELFGQEHAEVIPTDYGDRPAIPDSWYDAEKKGWTRADATTWLVWYHSVLGEGTTDTVPRSVCEKIEAFFQAGFERDKELVRSDVDDGGGYLAGRSMLDHFVEGFGCQPVTLPPKILEVQR